MHVGIKNVYEKTYHNWLNMYVNAQRQHYKCNNYTTFFNLYFVIFFYFVYDILVVYLLWPMQVKPNLSKPQNIPNN